MRAPLRLPPRRYGLRDAVRIPLRAAPVSAVLYALFELAGGVVAPLKALAVAGFIDSAIAAVQGTGTVRAAFVNLALIVVYTSYEWLERALHNFADLKLVLALRERYRTALVEKWTHLAYRHVEEGRTRDLYQRLVANAEGDGLKDAYFHLIDLAVFAVKVGGILLILSTAVWWAGLAILAVSAGTLAAGIRGGEAQYQADKAASRFERRCGVLTGVLTGREAAAERTLFGFSTLVNGLWRESFQGSVGVWLKARLRWYARSYAGNSVLALSWASTMVILLGPVLSGKVSVGLFISLTQSLAELDLVWGFMQTVNGIAHDREFFKDLTELLTLEERIDMPSSRGARTSPALESLELHGVRFRYPGSESEVLDGLSCAFLPGRHYAIVGANGAGKTTLTRLLTGLYPVQEGRILLNGEDIARVPSEELLSYFSIVYQDFARYGLTLRENIMFGRRLDGASNGASWDRLLERVGLADLVRRLPQGLDTPLGRLKEDGVDLSGGEWQRVAMARALALPAAIRILDEPTAALDPQAESDLYVLFARNAERRTTLFISHRLGATKLADEILVLADGRIIESGSHAALMDRGGLYRRMFESQRSWYEQ
jgi:ATP-binding cassette, subfamily B, bacterial